jgi:hypothetical protein
MREVVMREVELREVVMREARHQQTIVTNHTRRR